MLYTVLLVTHPTWAEETRCKLDILSLPGDIFVGASLPLSQQGSQIVVRQGSAHACFSYVGLTVPSIF